MKYVAVLLMVASHTLFAWGGVLREIGFWIGQPALPLFELVIALRLNKTSASRYLIKLIACGLISQPLYLNLLANAVERLNVMFSLAAAIGLWWMVDRRYWLAFIVGIGALIYTQSSMEFGGIVPISLALAVPLAKRKPIIFLLLISIVNSTASQVNSGFDAALFLKLYLGSSFVLLFYWLVARTQGEAYRVPWYVFYACYPMHFCLIYLIFGPYQI
jgi:hypothetical protein